LIELRSLPRRFESDHPTRVELRVHNEGRDAWLAGGPTPVFASYHWRVPCGDYVIYDGLRSTLPHDVAPGESCEVNCEVLSPSTPGRYVLEPEGHYFGTDIAQKAIDFCRERYPQPNFEFAVNEPTGIPIRDETFDFITLFSVLTHMLPEDIEKLTASLAQVLAPGGQLVADAFVSDQIRGYRGSHTKSDIEEAVLVRAFHRSGLEIASREHLNTEGDVRRVLFTLNRAG
jgi:SAM-dependent methyltransferase